MNHPGSLFKCGFVTSGSEMLHFYKLSGDRALAGTWNHTLKGTVLGQWSSTSAVLGLRERWAASADVVVGTSGILLASPV